MFVLLIKTRDGCGIKTDKEMWFKIIKKKFIIIIKKDIKMDYYMLWLGNNRYCIVNDVYYFIYFLSSSIYLYSL
jgi:hypothetical protein